MFVVGEQSTQLQTFYSQSALVFMGDDCIWHDADYITEPINAWVANGGLLRVVETTGTYLDAGTPSSWAAANVFVASQSM